MKAARILALDFDGVLCDGMAEYWQTAWQTYARLWQPEGSYSLPELERQFRQFRTLIEVGWEMPVLIRAIMLGIYTDRIELEWQQVRDRILLDSQLSAIELGKQLDAVRDEWIDRDLSGWLDLHRFYPGTIEMLKSLPEREIQPVIITTKEGRFVSRLLQQQGVELAAEFIWGKECRRKKADSLQHILNLERDRSPTIWFVEDRLNTLETIVARSELDSIELYLADWGYNTATDRSSLQHQSRIKLLSLDELPNLGDWGTMGLGDWATM